VRYLVRPAKYKSEAASTRRRHGRKRLQGAKESLIVIAA
jgi:hypothetical protein